MSRSDTIDFEAPTGSAAGQDDDDDEDDDDEDDDTNGGDPSDSRMIRTPTASVKKLALSSGKMLELMFDNDENPFTSSCGVLLAGRRRKKAKTYLIGPYEFGYTRKNNICKLKSNVLGTQFNAISNSNGQTSAEGDDRCPIVSIVYQTNVLGFKGPRKMRVFITKDCENHNAKSLLDTYKKNTSAVIQLKNMTPSWNIESQSYVLNFHGRVTQASVKNFQLIEADEQEARPPSTTAPTATHHQSARQQQHQQRSQGNPRSAAHQQQQGETGTQTGSPRSDSNANLHERSCSATYNGAIVMQFGRISSHEFTCDVSYPLSILQAFAIALSSFDSKLACE